MRPVYKWMLFALALLVVSRAFAGEAYLTGRQVTGSTKQCIYTYNMQTYVRTVRYIDICPMSITVPDF